MEAVIVTKALRYGSLAFLALAFLIQTGCDPDKFVDSVVQVDPGGNTNPTPTQGQNGDANGTLQPVSQIIVGSFNIQMFGKSKMSKPGVVSVLTDIARRFDILAIQELRDIDQNTIPQFLRSINADGSNYAAAVSERLGYPGPNTTHFEQLVYIYDRNKIELVAPTYAAQDRYEIMHRRPFIGHFRCLGVPPEQAFSFVLMNVHIDPEDAHVEFDALREIIGSVYANHRGEDDFILLGDMNEEPHKYQRYQWMPSQFASLPSAIKTNTVQTKAYDNIVFDSGYTSEYRRQAGVLNIQELYGLSLEDTKLVSDHYPVWAVFSSLESPRAEMTQGASEVIR